MDQHGMGMCFHIHRLGLCANHLHFIRCFLTVEAALWLGHGNAFQQRLHDQTCRFPIYEQSAHTQGILERLRHQLPAVVCRHDARDQREGHGHDFSIAKEPQGMLCLAFQEDNHQSPRRACLTLLGSWRRAGKIPDPSSHTRPRAGQSGARAATGYAGPAGAYCCSPLDPAAHTSCE